ncbi:MAG: hypothetical protein ACLTDC_02660 [Lachnospiraceae bacterium]
MFFGTIHREATDYLFRKMEEKGMYGFVGKVNMDCNSPEFLIETTEDSLRETEIYLDSHTGSGKVKPILAPRFAPTCSEKLMTGLGKLAAKYHCGCAYTFGGINLGSRGSIKMFSWISFRCRDL